MKDERGEQCHLTLSWLRKKGFTTDWDQSLWSYLSERPVRWLALSFSSESTARPSPLPHLSLSLFLAQFSSTSNAIYQVCCSRWWCSRKGKHFPEIVRNVEFNRIDHFAFRFFGGCLDLFTHLLHYRKLPFTLPSLRARANTDPLDDSRRMLFPFAFLCSLFFPLLLLTLLHECNRVNTSRQSSTITLQT